MVLIMLLMKRTGIKNKISIYDAEEIRLLRIKKISTKELSIKYSISQKQIYNIINNKHSI